MTRRIHGATTTVEYVFNCIVTCRIYGATITVEYVFTRRIHGVTTTVEYVFTCRIHGATITVEYVFFMLSQVSEQVHDKSSFRSSSVHVSI